MMSKVIMETFRKSKTDDDKNVKTGASTHTSLRPTTAPSWEELVTVNFEEKSAADEGSFSSILL